MDSRTKRPYETKKISKGGAIIFGLGLGALLATIAVVTILATPTLSTKLQSLPLYARSYYNKMFPPPQYLPTPAPTFAVAAASTQRETSTVAAEPTPAPTEVALSETDALPAVTDAGEPPAIDDVSNIDEAEIDVQPTEETMQLSQANLQPVGDAAQLTGFSHQWQTWNNCGPATITTHMSYFGRSETQADAALFLKPNENDKNVSPYQLAAYAERVGMEATLRQGGTVEQLKQFLSNDLPVLAETWLVHDGDGLGHYRLVTGFDDAAGQLITSDSLNGPDFRVSYQQFDADWRVFNRLYIVLYQPEQADLVAGIIGPKVEDDYMYKQLVATAEADIEANPDDQIAYFNKGEALVHLKRFDEATQAFDQARKIGLHWRRLWYQFTPFEAYYATERYQDVLDLAEATISNSGGLEEVYYYQGLALQALNQAGAEKAFQNAIEYNPSFSAAQVAMEALNESDAGQ